MLDALRDKIDAGATGGTIKIYTTPQPANADAAIGAVTLLATLTFSATSAPNAATGITTFSAITEDSSADADGTAVWARIADSNAATIFDCDVTATGAGGTIQLNTTSIVSGGPVRITSFTVTIPAA
jgi:hypothetical protein